MTDRHPEDELERFLAAERAAPAPASVALLARVLRDARALQHPSPAPRDRPRRRIGARLAGALRDLGGWPAVAGVTAAGMAGLWIGISSPALLDDMAGPGPEVDVLVDIAPDDLFAIEEGTTL